MSPYCLSVALPPLYFRCCLEAAQQCCGRKVIMMATKYVGHRSNACIKDQVDKQKGKDKKSCNI